MNLLCKAFFFLLGSSGCCNVDASCPLGGKGTTPEDHPQLRQRRLTESSATSRGEGGSTVHMCGSPRGLEDPPEFTFPVDIMSILSKIDFYQQSPAENLFDGFWTNWYNEEDDGDQLAKLGVMRGILDKYNLWGTYIVFPEASCDGLDTTVRQPTGICTDLGRPFMGSKGARFGRNIMPLQDGAKFDDSSLLIPNPRVVSRKLFTKNDKKEFPYLNLLATAWIQFQFHDWANHELEDSEDMYEIPLDEDDPFRLDGYEAMYVKKTVTDDRTAFDEAYGMCPVYPNEVTHWWDASQIYGSDAETIARLRAHSGGRLELDDSDTMLPIADDGFEDTGFRRNWWVGLGLMHNLFALEHNNIASMLQTVHPDWDDDQLFNRARMINAALLAKIHTTEWTPAIIPGAEVAMNTNWGGLKQYFQNFPPTYDGLPLALRTILESDFVSAVIDGLPGNKQGVKIYPTAEELRAAGVPEATAAFIANTFAGEIPFGLTEEFVSVYKMHPLLPDRLLLREIIDGKKKGKSSGALPLHKTLNADARAVLEENGIANLLFSFGVQKSNSLELKNYPELLQNFDLPSGKIDLGAVDILRDRERGVPRYNAFRRLLNLVPLSSIDDLTDDVELAADIKEVYGDDIEAVDAHVGFMAESVRPSCFGFGETIFQVFIGMASARIRADRFYTDDFNAETYTEEGIEWIENNSLKSVLLKNFPELKETGLADVTNAFFPWNEYASEDSSSED